MYNETNINKINKAFVTTGDTATLIGCSKNHVKALIKRGELCSYTTGGGHHRITIGSLRRYLGEEDEKESEKSYQYTITVECFNRCKKQANIRSKEWSVTHRYLDLLAKKQNFKCALSGANLSFWGNKTDMTSSLDRINSDIGYLEGNVQWVHRHINVMKWQFDQEYFINFCKMVAWRHQ